jgi:hypothetical protein
LRHSAAEVPEALRGTTSAYVLVRKHAVCVLGKRRLGDAIGRQVIPQLRGIAETDPDSEVRRLAALSLNGGKPIAERPLRVTLGLPVIPKLTSMATSPPSAEPA